MGALKTKNASTEAARGLVREIVAKAHTELPAMKATFVQICPSDYFTRKVSMKFTVNYAQIPSCLKKLPFFVTGL